MVSLYSKQPYENIFAAFISIYLAKCFTASRPVTMVQTAPRLIQTLSVVTRVVVVPAPQTRRISKYEVRRTPWRGYF
jgi:hypothetical protein